MTTTYAVDLLFGTGDAARKLEALERQFTQLDRAIGGTEKETRQLDRQLDQLGKGGESFRRIERGAKGAETAVTALSVAARRLFALFAASQAASFVFGKTAELETQTRSIETLTGSLTKARTIIKELQQYANVTPFESREVIDTAKQLSAFGVTADRVVTVTKRLGDIAGATGADLSGLALAYGQVVTKGRLQGEELLQFQERGVAISAELQRMYKLSGQELQKALEAGRIPAAALEVAIERLTAAGGKYANGAIAQSDTLTGKLSTLKDGVAELARTIGAILTPAIKGALDLAIRGVNALQALIDQQNNQRRELEFSARADAEINKRYGPLGFLTKGGEMADQRQRMIEQYRADAALERDLSRPRTAPSRPSAIPPLTGGTSSRGGGGSGGAGAASFPTVIDKSVLRQWLMSQGFGRTSGDFTNAGHRTPNHMLNAMDMGILGGSDAEALRKTAAMERMLRATGAFGDQLFGPLSDPYGHGAGKGGSNIHLHIPTPGGKVRVNAALAQLMGLGGKEGMAGDMAKWENQAAEETKRVQMEGLQRDEERLRITADQAKIGKSRLEQLQIEEKLNRDLLGIAQQKAALQPDPNAALRAGAEQARIDEQRAEVMREIARQAPAVTKLEKSVQDLFRTGEASPLEQETEAIRQGFAGVGDEIDALLLKLRELGSTPETKKLIQRLTGLKGTVASGSEAAPDIAANRLAGQLGKGQSEDALRLRLERDALRQGRDLNRTEQLQLDPTFQALPAAQQEALTKQAQLNDLYEQGNKQIATTAALIQDIGSSLAQGLGSAITGLIQGTSTLNDALSQTLEQIGQLFLNAAIQRLLGGISIGGTPLLPARASGGPVAAGQGYLVGEKGPELFLPGVSGGIVPSELTVPYLAAAGAEAAANGTSRTLLAYPGQPGAAGARGAAGTARDGRDGAAGLAGLAVPWAKPAGGQTPQAAAASITAAMAAAGPIDVNYRTVAIGDLPVVSQEDAEAIGREAAQRGAQMGAQMALSALQNSVGVRRKVGI